ncbi:hypothetical protein N7520_001595 [Penicillium odoratum]|uniref:uncharacterized protein n=1 Tax=Penicillium odoratum TaxID=1167516 RepID=UPI002546AE19|nr:uncharacterized protein N7520_001595 [Penicillium odoratum]KAJ5778349.1 hypothetical protein N7520_001595 [Penicillium odoratum]
MNGWTCPEELELHTFFTFLAKNKTNMQLSTFHQATSALLKLKGPVSAIRHAAIHRLIQDRESLLQINRVAIELVTAISGSSHSEKPCRLFNFLKTRLPKSDQLPEQPFKSKGSLRRRRYGKCSHSSRCYST